MSQHSIGPFRFITLDGVPDILGRKVEVIEHPGVDGVGIFITGRRGRVFTVTSAVDCSNKDTARLTAADYLDLIGTGPHAMVWSDLPLASEQCLVAVRDVRQLELTKLLGSSGGLNPPSQAWLVCEWDLILIET